MNKRFSIYGLVVVLVLLGCSYITQPAVTPSLATTPVWTASPPPTLSSTPTRKSCNGPYTWAYGTAPPEFVTRVESAMKGAGIDGTVKAGTLGEDNGDCGYAAMSVDYTFTVQTASLDKSADLAHIGASILEITRYCADPCPAPNLGNLNLIFQAQGQECQWRYSEVQWNALPGNAPNEITCPAP